MLSQNEIFFETIVFVGGSLTNIMHNNEHIMSNTDPNVTIARSSLPIKGNTIIILNDTCGMVPARSPDKIPPRLAKPYDIMLDIICKYDTSTYLR